MTDWNDFRACIYEGGHGFTDRDIIDRANEEINDLRARAEKAEAALAATVAEAEACASETWIYDDGEAAVMEACRRILAAASRGEGA